MNLTTQEQGIEGYDKLKPYLNQVENLVSMSKTLVIHDEMSAMIADNHTKNVKSLIKNLEQVRKSLVTPYNDTVKEINGLFKKATEPLNEAAKTSGDKYAKWALEKSKETTEEEPMIKPHGFRKKWDYEVTSELLVPRTLMSVDDKKVKAYIEANKDTLKSQPVKGIEFTEKAIHVS
jgi:hypothetical protein